MDFVELHVSVTSFHNYLFASRPFKFDDDAGLLFLVVQHTMVTLTLLLLLASMIYRTSLNKLPRVSTRPFPAPLNSFSEVPTRFFLHEL
jgi:hypothetical protein